MAAEGWQEIKVADRLAADREFRADPGMAARFLASWGPGENAALHLDESVALADEDRPRWTKGDPRPAELD